VCKEQFSVFVGGELIHGLGNRYTLKTEIYPFARSADWPAHGTSLQPGPQDKAMSTGARMLRDPDENPTERHPNTPLRPLPPRERRKTDRGDAPRLTRKQEMARAEIDGRLKGFRIKGQGDKREFRDTDSRTLNLIAAGKQ